MRYASHALRLTRCAVAVSRLFAVASSLSVPFFTIVLRKSYGLGAMAMSGGLAVGPNVFHASWPSAEAGGPCRGCEP